LSAASRCSTSPAPPLKPQGKGDRKSRKMFNMFCRTHPCICHTTRWVGSGYQLGDARPTETKAQTYAAGSMALGAGLEKRVRSAHWRTLSVIYETCR